MLGIVVKEHTTKRTEKIYHSLVWIQDNDILTEEIKWENGAYKIDEPLAVDHYELAEINWDTDRIFDPIQ